MALIYRFRGDSPLAFEILTDGVIALDESGTEKFPDDFHITEIRGQTFTDVANGMNFLLEETTRKEIMDTASESGYNFEELDDQDSKNTVTAFTISSYNPTRGGEAAALTSNIVLTFSENVAKAAATGPTVQLLNLTANTVVETFQFDSTAITVSTTAATINPTANLITENQYGLLIDNGYFTNTGAALSHGGIHNSLFYTFTAP